MSGHNKWSKIKHKKAATDAAKSKIFGKMAKLIKVAVKEAGGDVNASNVIAAVDRAKAVSMPKDNIERALKSAGQGADLEAITYEAYGPGGVAIIIETLTDSRNRTAAEIKHIFTKRGMELATPGSAAWAFKRDGLDWVANQPVPIDEAASNELASLIETLEEHDDVQDVYTNAELHETYNT